MQLSVGDRFLMKKLHPCGQNCFEVLRVGGDVRVRCIACGRELWMSRTAFEKAILSPSPENSMENTGEKRA